MCTSHTGTQNERRKPLPRDAHLGKRVSYSLMLVNYNLAFKKDGMLDEFAFILAHKSAYPLLYVLFQICSVQCVQHGT